MKYWLGCCTPVYQVVWKQLQTTDADFALPNVLLNIICEYVAPKQNGIEPFQLRCPDPIIDFLYSHSTQELCVLTRACEMFYFKTNEKNEFRIQDFSSKLRADTLTTTLASILNHLDLHADDFVLCKFTDAKIRLFWKGQTKTFQTHRANLTDFMNDCQFCMDGKGGAFFTDTNGNIWHADSLDNDGITCVHFNKASTYDKKRAAICRDLKNRLWVKDEQGLFVLPFGKNCMNCGKIAEKKCGKCHIAFYCSVSCQSMDWSLHKRFCYKGRSAPYEPLL